MCEHETKAGLQNKAAIYRELSEYYSGVLRSGKAASMHIGSLLAVRLAVPEVGENSAYDFNRLFIDPQQLLAPPHEAAYCGERTTAMRLECLFARQACEDAGLDLLQGDTPNGHLHYAFAYMSCLLEALAKEPTFDTELAVALWESYQLYLRDHLLNWIFDHLRDVRRFSVSDFCHNVAAAAGVFMQSEQEAMYLEAQEA
ncbi:chaperone TorD involved in molybdoenzyme TorA maturation [Selenomonas sp. GACV-9]|uniref:molecular chaperone TorD family protein n=1 Tax=Selenomonas sp. GACV-9 TaxID=3158782 RepID=UPI0008E320E9|nr:chaperone TorD involved in molybdoenzyme TorA maturation [Selenomonas ruminantium]